ncbi:MAG: proline dehydrogenase [Caldilineae bacterium]|nr:MAG: proline dehydrogenase [Caldilineae bacterium]
MPAANHRRFRRAFGRGEVPRGNMGKSARLGGATCPILRRHRLEQIGRGAGRNWVPAHPSCYTFPATLFRFTALRGNPMLRHSFIALSHSGAMQRFVTGFPPARRMARRFVAGEERDEALSVIRALNQAGLLATVDFLGEHVTEREAARANAGEYLTLLDELARHDLQAGISLKLSAMGLHVDTAFCLENMREIVARARERRRFVRIDMEESALVDTTLDLYRQLRREFDNVGTVLQAYLFRTRNDLAALIEEGIADIRLVKGAYDEPASIAWQERRKIQEELADLCRMMLSADARARHARLALGSHDDVVYNAVIAHALREGLAPDSWELQFLYGIRRNEQRRLVAAGQRMRIYVPYGHSWYPYFMRRLAERPANLLFFLRALVGD